MSRPRVVRTALIILAIAVVAVHVAFVTTVGILSADYRARNPRTTALMLYRGHARGRPSAADFVPLARMPASLVRAVIYIEDLRFYRHHGFDPQSIRFALELNRRLGYRAYGGSTITQQLARTLFLIPSKTYARKYFELVAAVEMEMILPKNRILELYLNYAEWGPDIWGAQSAALTYFGRDVAALSPEQIVRLVTIMPSPLRYTPDTFDSNDILVRRYRSVERYVRRTMTSPPELTSELKRVR